MKVLVTGCDGYIGSRLAPFLVERGHDVLGLDTGFYRDGWLGDGFSEPRPVLAKDVRDVTAEDVAGVDAVVHLGELSNDPLGQLDPRMTYELNYLGSLHLALAGKAAGVPRFVYSSSCSVYGAAADGVRVETSEPNPQTAYARCKVLVENALGHLADDDFSPTILRNATAYGASPRMRFDIVLNNLAGLAWTVGEIRMTSDGTPWRPLVHVLDICQAVACALEAPRPLVHKQVFNVGSDSQNYRVREIAEIVAGAFPGCGLSFGRSDGDTRSYRVGFEKIHTRLPGFRCAWDAGAGARELRGVFERVGLSAQSFEFRAFTRLRQLQHLLATGQLEDDFRWNVRRAIAA